MKEIVGRLQEKRQIELAKSILESKGYRVVKESFEDEDYYDLRDRILNELTKIMTTPEFGFSKGEVKDYTRVDPYFTDGHLVIEVGAEVDYDGLMTVCDRLNPIVREYDRDAYFEPVQLGLITAHLFV